jgi:hypothetical protein
MTGDFCCSVAAFRPPFDGPQSRRQADGQSKLAGSIVLTGSTANIDCMELMD